MPTPADSPAMPNFGYLLPTRGVVLSSTDPDTIAAKTEADIIGLAKRAEALDFTSVWVGDSILAKPRLEPLSTLAGVATATDAVGLGTAVYLPNLRHPVNVAHLTTTVDQLSGGRLALGIGVGIGSDVEQEHANLDIPFEHRGRRLDELLDCVTALWEGQAVTYDGSVYSLDQASIGFEPVREPPLYIASAAFDASDGFPRPIRERLIEHGDGWLPIALSPDTYASALARIQDRLKSAGRAASGFDPALYLDVVIDADQERALDTARAFYDAYYPAWDTLSDAEIKARGAFGPPAHVAETIAAYDDAGVETFVVRFTAPDQRSQLAQFTTLIH